MTFLLINGTKARIMPRAMYPYAIPPCKAPMTAITLVLELSCDGNLVPPFSDQLVVAFQQTYKGAIRKNEPKYGFLELRVPGCETELEAIDYMRDAGFKVSQQRAY